ncbi:MAG: hypothetical protein ABH878_10525 [bacterium]
MSLPQREWKCSEKRFPTSKNGDSARASSCPRHPSRVGIGRLIVRIADLTDSTDLTDEIVDHLPALDSGFP